MTAHTLNFNGKDSGDFGLYLADFDPMTFSGNFDQFLEVPYMDGSHLFPGKKKDRIILASFFYGGSRTVGDLNTLRDQVADWLNVSQRVPIISSGDPGKMWMGKPDATVSFPYMKIYEGEVAPVSFRADPFAYATGETDQTINVAGKVTNTGTQIVEPLIILTVTNAVANVTVTNTTTGDSFSITSMQSAGTVIEIDSGYLTKKTCKINGANGLGKLSGKFLTLAPGDNQITISNSNVTAQIKYRAKWL